MFVLQQVCIGMAIISLVIALLIIVIDVEDKLAAIFVGNGVAWALLAGALASVHHV